MNTFTDQKVEKEIIRISCFWKEFTLAEFQGCLVSLSLFGCSSILLGVGVEFDRCQAGVWSELEWSLIGIGVEWGQSKEGMGVELKCK